jgi:integrase
MLQFLGGSDMAIRQRTWTWKGKEKSAWVVDYFDAKGKGRLKTFRTKREADDWRSGTRIELKQGTHVADGDSVTVSEAGKLWLATGEENGLVYGSRFHNDWLLRLHIEPFLGRVMAAKYTGLHALRHFFCSWCAARKEDGGLGLPLKTVQARMGHSTLAMTADRYGHLFPSQDDAEVLAAGERALMGA